MIGCDICGAAGTHPTINSSQLREAVFLNGFDPFALGLLPKAFSNNLKELGPNIYKNWTLIVARDESDWGICSKCMAKLLPYLIGPPKAGGVESSKICFTEAEMASLIGRRELTVCQHSWPIDFNYVFDTFSEARDALNGRDFQKALSLFNKAIKLADYVQASTSWNAQRFIADCLANIGVCESNIKPEAKERTLYKKPWWKIW